MKKQHLNTIIRLWFDRLVSHENEHTVKEWLVSEEGASEKENTFFHIWEQLDVPSDSKEIQEGLKRFEDNRDAYEKSVYLRQKHLALLRATAAVALVVVAGAALWFGAARYYDNYYSYGNIKLIEKYVPEDGLDSLMLSDGTKVYVNEGSTIYYPQTFGRGDRDVYLVGEANFKVAKEKHHPFIVHAGNLNIEAVSTKFNVNAYQDNETITATLEEGLVKVTDGKHTSMLHPNEQYIFRRTDGHGTKNPVRTAPVISWTKGDMVFDNVTLRSIIETISKRFDVTIQMPSKVNLDNKYTMNFRHDESLKDILDIITSMSNGYHYHINGRRVIVYHSPS